MTYSNFQFSTSQLENNEHKVFAEGDTALAAERAALLECSFLGDAEKGVLPLHRDVPAALPYPLYALGKTLGEAAMAMREVIQAPEAICAQSVLAAASLACQPYANIGIDGRAYPLSLFLLSVAESGDRKSAVDRVALDPVYRWQQHLQSEYQQQLHRYQFACDVWKIDRQKLIGQKDRQGEPPREPSAPLKPFLLCEEPTFEGLAKLLEVGQPSVGVFSDEGGGFLGGYAMKAENRMLTIAGLCQLWDGKPLSRVRSKDGSSILYGRRVCLHLMAQEVLLERIIQDDLIEGQGLLSRILMAFPPSLAGSRPYNEKNIFQEPAISRYHDAIVRLLDNQFPVDPFPAPQNELKPRVLCLCVEAKAIWRRFHDEMDKAVAKDGDYAEVRRSGHKAAEQALRIAGILALFENIDAVDVSLDEMSRAITLVRYYLNEQMRVRSYSIVDRQLKRAKSLLEWVQKIGVTEVWLGDVYQRGPRDLRDAQTARTALRTLERHGLMRQVPGGAVVDGKVRQEVWALVSPSLSR